MKFEIKRIIFGLSVAFLVCTAIPQTAFADPFPLPCQGRDNPWTIDGNGFRGMLVVNVDANGNVTGSLIGGLYNEQVSGFYDANSSKLTFIRIPAMGLDTSYIQVYTGQAFASYDDPSLQYGLAGTFQAFAGTAASANRSVFGWFATCP